MNKEEQAFELGWLVGHQQTKEDYLDKIGKILDEIETDLYNIRAGISLTFDMSARKQAKELLGKIKRMKNKKYSEK